MEFLQNNFLTDFFLLCLNGLNSLFGNYAVSIIVLTVLIRLAMLPLDLMQKNNQARMQALGPEIQSLQKRYANNPQQMQRKQQELYRKMNVRPMLGCLPMLIQLPFLFAFFGAMRALATEQTVAMILNAAQFGPETVDIPQFFWVHNFWQPDSGMANVLMNANEFLSYIQTNGMSTITPETLSMLQEQGIFTYAGSALAVNVETYNTLAYRILEANEMVGFKNGWFILPALCGVALFVQQKFAPSATGGANPMMGMAGAGAQDAETQQAQGCSNKVMMWVMPIFSVWICLQGNTAFSLYWFTSSMYAFGQTRIIDFFKKRKAKREEIVIS